MKEATMWCLFLVLMAVLAGGGFMYHQADETFYEKCIDACDGQRYYNQINRVDVCLDNCYKVLKYEGLCY